MVDININFNNIRPINGSVNDGFEEFVCQLARKETIPTSASFVRNGKPDGGVECYHILQDDSIVAWQAKYFIKSFETSQYQQIDDSVKTALKSYPKLTRYIIAVPVDPSDVHIKGKKSMKDRIYEYVDRWKDINPNVIFEFWWTSDLIARLQKPLNQGMAQFWFGKYEFLDEDILQFNKDSILDLGHRYTPKLNVKVEATKYFDILSRGNECYNFFNERLDSIENICRKIKTNEYLNNTIDVINNIYDSIKQIRNTKVVGVDNISLDKLKSELLILESIIKNNNSHFFEEDRFNYYKILEIIDDTFQIYNDLDQEFIRLINDPILILEGNAGTGKSHLMADIVSKREKEKQYSLLLLGQKFITDEEPLTQIMRMLNFEGSSEKFLGLLEAKAETSRHRIIIFIDAINEGKGLTIWQNNIRSFIDKIRRHPWIGLVLSIRSSYLPVILPTTEFDKNYCVRVTHNGFGKNTQNAIQIYFKEYGILYPSVPLLNPEFQNPLFLRLFCEGLNKNGYKKIPDGIRGISSVMNLYFEGVENSLRKQKQYSLSIRCIEKAVNKYTKFIDTKNLHAIPIDKAIDLFSAIYPSIFCEGELLDYLLSEGLFCKTIFQNIEGKYIEYIYLTYERFENILQANCIVDELENDNTVLIKRIQSMYHYKLQGVLESLAILLPERKGVELYEILPEFRTTESVVNAVLYSLIWRKEDTISSHLYEYFTEFMDDNGFRDNFYKTLLELGFNYGNYFNADSLHKLLMSVKLADRDAMWVPMLYRIYNEEENVIERIFNWTWNESNEINIDVESIRLGSIMLSWLLASTNRKLRDMATKVLIKLLHNRINILVTLLEKFSEVDDPYIQERLYAVALGCVVRTNSKEHITNLCQCIYSLIFNVEDEVYPHVLLRDYASRVIEYAISIGIKLNIDVKKTKPPYISSLHYRPVSSDEIELIMNKCGTYEDSPGMCCMLTSMFTEYTTIGRTYGDFGRYVFQRAFNKININPEILSNIAIKLIIEKYGYTEDKHGKFDKIIGSGRGRTTIPNERIGKKYQWMALHELFARFSDNIDKLGQIGKENKFIYEGPWKPNLRDIDPTYLTIESMSASRLNDSNNLWWAGAKYTNWDSDIVDWLNIKNDFPTVETIIELRDCDDNDWVALECYPDWSEPHKKDSVYKNIWYQIRSCIVDEDEFLDFYDWAKKQNFGGGWMPECNNMYELFYREYYWSSAYVHFEKEGITRRKIYDKKINKLIATVNLTTIGYLWEAEEDFSNVTSIYQLIPSKQLFDGMKMKFSDNEGEFLDEYGNIICFETSIIDNSKNYLLVRKDALIDYLKKHHKKIVWYVLGEKNVIGPFNFYNNKNIPMYTVASGTYTLDDYGKIIGNLSISHTRL